MSSMPECKRCGNYVHHGPVICDDCLTSVLDEVDRHLVGTVGTQWTYAKDIAGVIRQAFSCGRSKMPPALLPEERETGELRYPLAPNAALSGGEAVRSKGIVGNSGG